MADQPCPECGQDLTAMSAEELKAHRGEHWEGEIPFPSHNKEAVRRSQQLDKLIAQREGNEKRSQARDLLKGGE